MTLPRSLRARIALTFMALLAAVQCATLLFANAASYDAARGRIADELDVGARVFLRLLNQDAERLAQVARALAADFAFREAATSGDAATLASALDNLSARVQAGRAYYADTSGRLVASSGSGLAVGGDARFVDLVDAGRRSGSAHRIVALDGRAYQVVAVAVRAPVTIGWVLLCFPVDATLAGELRRLTGLDVTFIANDAAGTRVVASTLPAAEAADVPGLAAGLAGGATALVTDRGDGPHQGRAVVLGSGAGSSVTAVLERPVDPALKYSRYRRNVLLGLGALALLMTSGLSVLIARGITRPLQRLQDAVHAIRAGDYSHPVSVEREDEVGAVARGLDHMREGIREREARILALAYQDSLTGLPNRARLETELAARIARAEPAQGTCALLVLGLDRFHNVNDALGHVVGDTVLADLAGRLAALAAGEACVARLGGDEFALLLPDADVERATAVARRVHQMLEEPFARSGQAVDLRASIGVSVYPRHGTDAGTLLRNADVAMYAAKQDRSGFAVFDPALDKAKRAHLSLLGELKLAVERDELEVHYQPKMSIADGSVEAAEALLRWRHPERGLVPAGMFIPFAEQTGYIKVLTRWVLRAVVRQIGEWRTRGIDVQVAVNLSTRDVLSDDLPASLAALLHEYGVPATSLRLEVTESGFLEDPRQARLLLNTLVAAGHSISIDDYGTGYSSLSYLRALPVDELKLDRSFVKDVVGDAALATIVRCTVEMAHGLGLHVVAEGVEDPEVLGELGRLGCDSIQGYLLTPPLPAPAFEAWLAGAASQARPAPAAPGSDTPAPAPEPAQALGGRR